MVHSVAGPRAPREPNRAARAPDGQRHRLSQGDLHRPRRQIECVDADRRTGHRHAGEHVGDARGHVEHGARGAVGIGRGEEVLEVERVRRLQADVGLDVVRHRDRQAVEVPGRAAARHADDDRKPAVRRGGAEVEVVLDATTGGEVESSDTAVAAAGSAITNWSLRSSFHGTGYPGPSGRRLRATHSAQTHALPLAAAGNCSSNAAGIDTCAHQHGPLAPAHEPSAPHATAQRFGCPHSGQRVGSGSVIPEL